MLVRFYKSQTYSRDHSGSEYSGAGIFPEVLRGVVTFQTQAQLGSISNNLKHRWKFLSPLAWVQLSYIPPVCLGLGLFI